MMQEIKMLLSIKCPDSLDIFLTLIEFQNILNQRPSDIQSGQIKYLLFPPLKFKQLNFFNFFSMINWNNYYRANCLSHYLDHIMTWQLSNSLSFSSHIYMVDSIVTFETTNMYKFLKEININHCLFLLEFVFKFVIQNCWIIYFINYRKNKIGN